MSTIFFPKVPLCLLRENGDLEGADGERLESASSVLVLSRAFCRFRRCQAPSSLSQSAFAQAARLEAEANAPFTESRWLIFRVFGGAVIWYWDADAVHTALGGRGAYAKIFVPEPLLRAPGEGWRIVACVDGQEAQYWRNGALAASLWRRGSFSPSQWSAFVLGVDDAEQAAPKSPPDLVYTALDPHADWRKGLIGERWGWKQVERGALGAAVAAAALAGGLAGQAMRLDAHADGADSKRIALEARADTDPVLRSLRADAQIMRRFEAVFTGPDVAAAAADALEAIGQSNLHPRRWRIDDTRFRADLNVPEQFSDGGVSMRDVAAALEASSRLENATPVFLGRNAAQEAGSVQIEADLTHAPVPASRHQAQDNRLQDDPSRKERAP